MIHNIKNRNGLSGFYVVFNGGMLNETAQNRGWSHLIEHLMCHRMKELEYKFNLEGVTWNAYTSTYTVCFYFYGLDRSIRKYRETFLDIVCGELPDDATFKTEKKIVLEEYKGAFSSQGGAHLSNLFRKRYDCYLPIGNRTDIENATHDQVAQFHRNNFGSPSEIVNISRTALEREQDFNSFSTDKDFPLMAPDFTPTVEKTCSFDEKTSIIYALKVNRNDAPYCDLISSMFGSGLYSPLMTEVRLKQGLVYGINCRMLELSTSCSDFGVSTITSNNNVEQVRALIDGVIYNGKKYLTKKRFKEIVSQKRNLLKINDLEIYHNAENILDKPDSLNSLLRRSEINYEQMMEVYERNFSTPLTVYLDK